MGRVDDQVKINGQRVELAEIESAVLRSPMVRDATALVVGDRLTAIVVLADGHDTAWMRTLSETAAHALPAAWLPKDWVAVAEIPRQATSGKADRRALVDLCRQASERTRADDVPANDVESEIGRALAQLIGLGSDALIDRDEPFADIEPIRWAYRRCRCGSAPPSGCPSVPKTCSSTTRSTFFRGKSTRGLQRHENGTGRRAQWRTRHRAFQTENSFGYRCTDRRWRSGWPVCRL